MKMSKKNYDSDSSSDSDFENNEHDEERVVITFDMVQIEIDDLYIRMYDYTRKYPVPFLQHNSSYYWFMKLCDSSFKQIVNTI